MKCLAKYSESVIPKIIKESSMNSYIFSGKVLPERANVNITPIELKIDAIDAGISGTAVVSIDVSQVSVVLNTNSNSDLMTLKNYVDYSVRTLIDAFGYLSGRGYDIEITSVVNHEGKHAVFGVGIPELEKSQKERPLSFQQLLEAMAKSQYLHRALSDLREAIRSPVDTGFFCYRAVESIRQNFKNDNDNDAKSWENLRKSLLIDRSWIDKIKEFADKARHGETPYISGKNRILIMQHTWKVIDRFCLYVYGDFNDLSEKEFDLLKQV